MCSTRLLSSLTIQRFEGANHAFSQAVSPNGRPPWAMRPGDLVDLEVMDFQLSRTGKKGDFCHEEWWLHPKTWGF